MGWKFTRDENKRRAEIAAKIAAAIDADTDAREAFATAEAEAIADFETAVEQARADYAAAIIGARSALEAAVAGVEEALAEAREWADEIASEREGEYEEKSEKWQESEAGERAREWIDRVRAVADMDTYEPDLPSEDAPDVEAPEPWDGNEPEVDAWEALTSEDE